MSQNNSVGGQIVLASTLVGGAIAAIVNPSLIIHGTLGGVTAGSVAAVATDSRRHKVVEGRSVVNASKINISLGNQRYLQMAGMPLEGDQEKLSILVVGKSGSGKSQANHELISSARQRSDYRLIFFDRESEYLKSHFNSSTDLIFNPEDKRSVGWNARNEQPLSPDTIAEAILPTPLRTPDQFWYEAGRMVIAEMLRATSSNQEMKVLLNSDLSVIRETLRLTPVFTYLVDDRMATSILAVIKTAGKFYNRLLDENPNQISFYNYAKRDQSSWLFLPMHNDQNTVLKPLLSMAIDLMILGVLSRNPSSQNLKTIFVIDELSALQKLPSLTNLLERGRKFGASACLGVQSISDIKEIYDVHPTASMVNNIHTKLILSCSEYENAEYMARLIGDQRIEQQKTSKTSRPLSIWDESETRTTEESERYVVPPRLIQSLCPLEGYKVTADKSPVKKFKITYRAYPEQNPGFIQNDNLPDAWHRDIGL